MDIPGYKVIRELGRGGMASVYLAVQESLHREIALKVMAPGFSTEPDFRERFLREGRRNAQLQHPNIVILYDAGYAADRYYIAMEYLRSGHLKDRMQAGLGVASAIRYTKQIASALGYAHKNGIIHRDIKPLNIMFRDESTAVLTDFGIAKALSDSNELTRTHMAIGTPYYMSPEQARGLGVDGRSDLYSLGILFYEMLVGERPYVGEEAVAIAIQHLTAPIPKLPPNLAVLQPVLDRVLAKTPEERYPDAAGFISDLERLERELTHLAPAIEPSITPSEVTAPREAAPTTATKTVTLVIDRKTTVSYALVVALVLSVGGAWWWTSRSTLDPQTQRTVQLLIEKAQRHIDASRLATPAGDNAAETYREVLALDPGNSEALAGIESVLERIEELVKRNLEEGRYEQALQLVQEGLDVAHDRASLESLRAQIKTREKIEELVARGNEQLAANKLVEPSDDNAAASFRAALDLGRGDKAARQGLESVGGRLLEAARRELELGDIAESARLAEQGTRLGLKSDGFENLQKEIDERRREAERQRVIAGHLEDAGKLVASRQLIAPPDRNALKLYREVIELDPTNPVAPKAIAEIERTVVAEARGADKEKDPKSRIDRVTAALKAFPANPELRRLEAALTAELAARRRSEQASELIEAVKRSLETGEAPEAEIPQLLARLEEAHGLDPENPRIAPLIKRLTSVLASRAKAALSDQRVSDAIRLAELGLGADPHDEQLRNVLRDAKQQIAAAREREQEIQRLLRVAKELANRNRLVVPAGENAYATYGRILELDPANAEAKKAREAVLRQVVEKVEASRKAGDLDTALKIAEAGLGSAPGLEALKELRQIIVSERKLEEQERKIARLLDAAARHLAQGRLGVPKDDNALAVYRRVLELDSANSVAKDGIETVRQRYLKKIRGYLGAETPRDGVKWADEALAVFPKDAEVAELRAALDAEIEDRLGQKRIAKLWSRARAQLEAGRFTEPAGDNALESYREILEIDPDSILGKTGSRDLKEALVAQAGAAVTEGDLERARALITEAYRVSPNDPEIAAVERRAEQLQKEIDATADQRDREQRFAGLLEQLAKQLEGESLSAPDGDSAMDTLAEMQALIPGDGRLAEARESVLERYVQLAESRRRKGDYPATLALIEEAERFWPEDRRWKELRDRVAAARRENKREKGIAELEEWIGRGQDQLRSNRLTQPQGDNALETFRRVLERDPGNQQARKGIGEIADRYAALARRAGSRGRWGRGLTYVKRGLEVEPGNSALRALEDELKRQRAAAARAAKAEPPPAKLPGPPAKAEPVTPPADRLQAKRGKEEPRVEAAAPKIEPAPKQEEQPKPEPEAPRRTRIFATF